MTGNEPGATGEDEQDSQRDAPPESQRGNMLDAEDDAARDVDAERTKAAAAGDEQAKAEQADKPDRLHRAAEWLDGKLAPRLGAGDVGPYDEEPERSHDECPICGQRMREHTIDRSTGNAVLNCPAPAKPTPQSFEPLNEVGMTKRRPEDRA